MALNKADGNSLSAETYNNYNVDSGTIYNDDIIKLAYINDTNKYDKDLHNYNSAIIQEFYKNDINRRLNIIENFLFDKTNENNNSFGENSTLKQKASNELFPVGSIIITVDDKSPSTQGLSGTWERIAKGKCLFGVNESSDSDSTPQIGAGETGGHADPWFHTHETVDSPHNHEFKTETSISGEHTHMLSNGNYQFRYMGVQGGESSPYWQWDSTVPRELTNKVTNKKKNSFSYVVNRNATDTVPIRAIAYPDTNGKHTHDCKGTTDFASSNLNIQEAPRSPEFRHNSNPHHANLPPYIGVYFWKRTA